MPQAIKGDARGRRRLSKWVRRWAGWWEQLPPAAGSAVMATGILSVGLHLVGAEPWSRLLLGLALLGWLVLAAAFARRLLRERARWAIESDTPPALTAVAATTVLGTRCSLLGWQPVAAAALAVAVAAWAVLLPSVLRHWGRRMPGAVFLVCVATQGLAVLAATLAATRTAIAWLTWPALVCFGAGLVLYVVAFTRFDRGQVRRGAGDQWVAGGALAISALAGAKLLAMPVWTGVDDGSGAAWQVLRAATLLVLALDLLWYGILAGAELRWPRPGYDLRRWATVFPMGMTAVATLSVAAAANTPWLRMPGQVLLGVALTVWCWVAAGLAA